MIRRPPKPTLFPDTPLSRSAGLTAADLAAARLREPAAVTRVYTAYAPALFRFFMASVGDRHLAEDLTGDRKSTRLNSSHANISYAVFCLKKKNTHIFSVHS